MEFTKNGKGRMSNMPEPTVDLSDHPDIKGFEPSIDLSAKELVEKMSSIGFQASHLGSAFEIIKTMRREEATIFLSFTGNMISSGLRELICYLVKNKYVDAIITNAGGVEEDIIKCFAPFKLGSFSPLGKVLYDKGVHRIGNIFVPTDRYTKLDQFLTPLCDEIFTTHQRISPLQLLRIVGERLDHDESVLTWAARNDIPVFCPGIQDGSFGQIFYFRSHKDKKFSIDISRETKEMIDISLNAEKTGAIILGGGIAKHFTLLGNIFRDGLDYSVYINTGIEHDGSDSGGSPQEAISWSKLHVRGLHVKVWCDATIAFPLLCSAWMQWEKSR